MLIQRWHIMDTGDMDIDDTWLGREHKKKITVTKSTYLRLQSVMRADDTFDDVIHRLIDNWDRGYVWTTPKEIIDFSKTPPTS